MKLNSPTKTKSLHWQQDRNHFFHPYTDFTKFDAQGSTIYARGSDHFVYDENGKRYLDGIAGLWCVNIGHGNRELADYMADQAGRLAYYNTFGGASSPPAAQLASKLASLAPGSLNRTFFGTGGSMANDTAIKIAHYYFNQLGKKSKKKILSRNLGYHGSTYLAHALTGIASTHEGFDLPIQGLVHHMTAPYEYRRPKASEGSDFCDFLLDEMESTIQQLGADNIAAFIAEPILGAGGVIVPPKDYNRRTWELCKKYDLLYIADEVVTAFGRLGHMFASERVFDVRPDMLVLAKGISSGYVPLGATMITDEVYEVISAPKKGNPYFSHGFTYSGHALACAVGLKNIEIIERDGFCQHVQEHGPYFEQRLKELEQYPIVGEVRGKYFMLGIEFVQNSNTKELFDTDEYDVAYRIYEHCKFLGAIVRPVGNIVILSPPLTFDYKAIDDIVEIISKAIEKVMVELKSKYL